MRRRTGRVVLAILVAGLAACDHCRAQRIEIDPSKAAELGAGAPADIEVRAQAELTWHDRDGASHAERVDLKLWLRGTTAVACDVSSLGSRVAWVGGSGSEWWLFERRDEGMRLTSGSRDRLDPGSPLSVFLSPALVRVVLALTPPEALGTAHGMRVTWMGPVQDGRPAGLDLSLPAHDVTWHVQWSGDRKIGGAGAGLGSIPSTIVIGGAAGTCTMWVSTVTPSSGKPAFFDLGALRSALLPVTDERAP